MNLQLILSVALSLIFIYLILSLLASEIQELISTVFQWRAEHLRKSIEILLGGDVDKLEQARVIQLTNQIYDNPLIQSLNQQAKGFFETLPRRATWAVGALYRFCKKARPGTGKRDTIFGKRKHTGPSYIPADIFATTLMDTLQLPILIQNLTELRIEKFKDERLNEIRNVLLKLQDRGSNNPEFLQLFQTTYQDFTEVRQEFGQIIENFKQNKATLQISINSMAKSLDKYIESFESNLPKDELFAKSLRQLKFIRKDIFDDADRAILLGGLRPTIQEVVQSINTSTAVYKEIESAIKDKDSATYQKIQELINILPSSVTKNLTVWAKRVQATTKTSDEGINILKQEIENVFDNSMERASGVYKRNAKGVTILIGLFIAVAANVDTFSIVNRLSKDSQLRDTMISSINQFLIQNGQKSATDLDSLRNQANELLKDTSLPIGWTNANLEQQIGWTTHQHRVFPRTKLVRAIPGWILSGFAIAMGAPFWFDLLGKIMNVRNTGKPPKKD